MSAAEEPWVSVLRRASSIVALCWGAYGMTHFRTHWYGGFLAFRDLALQALEQ